MKCGIVSFFCFLLINLAFSQNSSDFLKITQIEDSIVLVKNENNILPIINLKDAKIACLNVGIDSVNIFQKRLGQYAPIDHFYFTGEKDFQEFHNNILKYNWLIIAYYEDGNYSSLLDYLNDWQEEINILHVGLVPNQSFFDSNDFKESYCLIHANGNSTWHQDLVAQSIFSGVSISDEIANSILARTRLKFTLPEEFNIDSEALKQRIDSVVSQGLIEKAYPGCQVLLVKDGKVFFHESYGFHTYDSTNQVLNTDIYDLASITKVTAATAGLMKLHDEGKFGLDMPAKTYWPDFRFTKKANLTFRSILAHNARLKSWIPYWKTTLTKRGKYKWNTLSKRETNKHTIKLTDDLYLYNNYKNKIYRMIRFSKLNPEPGYVYSGLSFYLYPEIISNLSGQEYEKFLKDEFYRPLGASTLTFNAYKHFPKSEIIPTEVDTFFRQIPIHGQVHDEGAAMMDGVSGNAGLFGSAIDLAKVWQMFLNMGEYGGKRYLSNQTVRKFTTCQYCEEGNRRGLGFDKPLIEYDADKSSVAKEASPESFGHSGYTGTFVWADPENGLLFIFLSNRVNPTRENRKLYELNIRPRIHTIVYEELVKAGF